MKAWFIFKDNALVGYPLGYTTAAGARKSLVGSKDWYAMKRKYGGGHMYSKPSDDKIAYYDYKDDMWLFNQEKWSKEIWAKYIEDHYKIVEKEFDIVFRD